MIRQDQIFPERRLRGVLDDLATMCSRYGSLTHAKSMSATGRTKLDKERMRLCQREVVSRGFASIGRGIFFLLFMLQIAALTLNLL